WGMSEAVGLVATMPPHGHESPLGRLGEASPAVMELVDSEVRRLVDESYKSARQTLIDNRDKLDALAAALLEHETLDEIDAYAAAQIDRERNSAQVWSPTHN
ncbi:MAG: hypothetical protein ACR2PK_09780, partial [Acidimicrobiales bacterium]